MDTSCNQQTKQYGLIGYPVKHSISPVIHNSIFTARQLNARYMTLAIPPQHLSACLPLLRENFSGFNVTIPHKEAIMEYLDAIDQSALLCGAVNTVKNDNGRLTGYNTDSFGFIKTFDHYGLDAADKKVLLIGAGGGARGALVELLRRNCAVTIVNRTPDRAHKLATELAGRFPGTTTVLPVAKVSGAYDILVNTTPVGMAPETAALPFRLEQLESIRIVYDFIYNPFETSLLSAARQAGLTCINGLPMLLYQAVAANSIWTGLPLDEQLNRNLYSDLVAYMKTL